MHDAAHAALLATGYERPDVLIKTHHSLIAEFGKKLVLGGQIDAIHGRAFNRCGTCDFSPITAPSRPLSIRQKARLNRPGSSSRRSGIS